MAHRKLGPLHYLGLLVALFVTYQLVSSYFFSSSVSVLPAFRSTSSSKGASSISATYHLNRATVELATTHLDNVDSFWAFLSTWKPALLNAIDKYVDGSTVFLDAGAWEGPALFYAARRASVSLGVEPDPVAFRALRAHQEVNPKLKNIILTATCLSDRPEKLRMAGDGAGTSAVERVPLKYHDEKIRLGDAGVFTVECVTVLSHLSGKGVRGDAKLFIKMDLEGAEAFILPGLAEWVAARPVKPVFYLGIHETLENLPPAKAGKILTFVQQFKLCGRDVDDLVPCSSVTMDTLKAFPDIILADY